MFNPNRPEKVIQMLTKILKSLTKVSKAAILMALPFAFAYYSITKVAKIAGGIGVAIANTDPAAAMEALNDFGYLFFAQAGQIAFEFFYAAKHMMHDLHEAKQELRKLKIFTKHLWHHLKKKFGKPRR